MDNLFKKQLKENKPISLEKINELKHKNFSSGRSIKENDVILYALDHVLENIDNENRINVTLITLHPDEINHYQYDENTINNFMPIIKRNYQQFTNNNKYD